MSELKYVLNEFPMCPYCDYKDVDVLELYELQNDGDIAESECPDCGEVYEVDLFVRCSYTTRKRGGVNEFKYKCSNQ